MAKKKKFFGAPDAEFESAGETETAEVETAEEEVGTVETVPEAEVKEPVTMPKSPAGKIIVDREQFLRHIRRLLIGATDRMIKNGTRRTVSELTGYTQEEANLVVEECKRIKM